MYQFNKIKKLVFTTAFLAGFIIVLSGCKKFLETQAQGTYDAENYPYPGGSGPYDQYIFGAYNDLRSYSVHVFGFLMATNVRSDDADKGSTAADGGADALAMDNFPVLPSNSLTNALWTGYYGLINKCNVTIKEVNTNVNIVATDAVKKQTIAEARFIRGYGYFMLVRLFGRVPIIDSVFTNPAAQNNVPQSSAAQVYTFIESDLTYAAANLPLSWDAKFAGRATSGAANGILAKVYLTQQKWAQAMATANLVITAGQYDLSTPYDKIFREEGENSKESVFEVQATASATVQTANGIQYCSVQGVRGTGIWDLGWGFNSPSQNLADFYEANDPRRARTILFASTATVPGLTIYGETTPTGLPNPRYNNKVYCNPAFRNSTGSRFGWWMNVRILRYADVVLMYAEAANELGGTANIAAAQTAVNSIRARARQGAATGTLPDVNTTDQTTLRDAIRRERRAELAMEHERFFDLVRWGVAQSTLQAVGKTNFSNSRDVLLPIPQVQIDLTQGVLTQNPGY